MPDVLFVCSGNTCRSPMAAALFNALCIRKGLRYRAESAGLYALEGSPASDGAFYAMKERGISLSRHVAQPLSTKSAGDARLVVAMSASYAARVRERCPWARVVAFEPPIGDPYGGSPAEYCTSASELENRMEWVLAQLEAQDSPPPAER